MLPSASLRSLAARVQAPVAARLGVDRRALATFRVGLGVLLLADLLLRARHLRAFYTDAGAVPRAVVHGAYPAYTHLSLHALSGAAWWQWLLFALAGVAAVALLVGYRTRVAALVSFVLLVSLHARNPFVLNAGDVLLRRLLFWGLFLPLGGYWAVDRRALRRDTETDRRVTSVAGAALLGQVVLVYLVNAAFKLRGGVWTGSDAVGQVLALGQFTRPFGAFLGGFDPLTAALTWVWLGLLCGSWLLVVLRGWWRAALVTAFAGFHLGMALTLRVGLFPFVSTVALVPFLPPVVWDRLADGRGGEPSTGHPATADGEGLDGWATRLRRAGSVALAVLFALLVVWNAATVGLVPLPGGAEAAVETADREWNMFAPSPPDAEVGVRLTARLATGERVDALTGRSVGTGPPDTARAFPGPRWRKYLTRVGGVDATTRTALAGYLCRRATGRAGAVERVTVRRYTRPLDGGQTSVGLLAERRCRN